MNGRYEVLDTAASVARTSSMRPYVDALTVERDRNATIAPQVGRRDALTDHAAVITVGMSIALEHGRFQNYSNGWSIAGGPKRSRLGSGAGKVGTIDVNDATA
jgi:hypothetical protein